MSEITPRDEVRAALHRLRERDGYPAVEALLARVGAANVNNVSENAYEEVMAACPPLPVGEGIMAASGDRKPEDNAAKINQMGADRNAKVNAARQGEDISGALKTTLDQPDGFSTAAKGMNLRGGLKQAKAK